MPNFDTRLAYVNLATVELAVELIDTDLYRTHHRQSIERY